MIEIQPAGATFFVPGGARGEWRRQTDGTCTSPFPFAVVNGRDAEGIARTLLEERPGNTPIVLGRSWEAADVFAAREYGEEPTVDAILVSAAGLDLEDWMQSQRISLAADRGTAADPWPTDDKWPDRVAPVHELSSLSRFDAEDRKQKWHEEVVIGLTRVTFDRYVQRQPWPGTRGT